MTLSVRQSARFARLLALAATLSLAACGEPVADPAQIPVAFVGEEKLTLSELQEYFDSNLLRTEPEEEAEPEAGEMEIVWSRLFDAFVEERLLRRALDTADGVQLKAAEMLGIHRNTLRNKLGSMTNRS